MLIYVEITAEELGMQYSFTVLAAEQRNYSTPEVRYEHESIIDSNTVDPRRLSMLSQEGPSPSSNVPRKNWVHVPTRDVSSTPMSAPPQRQKLVAVIDSSKVQVNGGPNDKINCPMCVRG